MQVTTTQLFFIGIGITTGLSLFAKYCPKEKINNWLRKPCYGLGVLISKFLILKLGKKSAEKVENGLIATVLDCSANIPFFILQGILEDNAKPKPKKEKKK